MGKNSIQAGTGIRHALWDARPYSDHAHSGSPFQTEIGVGKVIKAWDEGELLSIGSSSQRLPHAFHIYSRSTIIAW